MRYLNNQLVLLFALVFTVACSSAPSAPPPAPEPEQNINNVFYFDFDESEIKPEAFADLDAHAENILNALASDGSFTVTIEGHCDERGTIGYNLALGNRRAEAVARYLRVKGVPASNLITESYGEERPAVEGSGESVWAQNRRAVVLY